jgi:uncharacterized protein
MVVPKDAQGTTRLRRCSMGQRRHGRAGRVGADASLQEILLVRKPESSRHVSLSRTCRPLAFAGFIVAAVGVRGVLLARLAGGRYPFCAFLFDVIALSLCLGAVHLLDFGIRWCLRKFVGDGTLWRNGIVQLIRLFLILLVAFPFLLVAVSIHPQRIACHGTPERFGLRFETVVLQSEGIPLEAWYVPGRTDSGGVVLVAHGLGANKENFLLPVLGLHAMGYPTLIFDFRAHGNSGGLTTTFGLRESEDVKAAHDWLVQRHPGRPICAVGYSMGGAAVARAAHQYGIFERIVLDSTFSDFRNIAQRRILRYFGPLQSFAWIQGRFWAWFWTGADLAENCPASYAESLVNKPVLLIHGKADPLIPWMESVRMQRVLNMRPELWLVEGAGHAETVMAPDYEARLRRFLDRTNE